MNTATCLLFPSFSTTTTTQTRRKTLFGLARLLHFNARLVISSASLYIPVFTLRLGHTNHDDVVPKIRDEAEAQVVHSFGMKNF